MPKFAFEVDSIRRGERYRKEKIGRLLKLTFKLEESSRGV